ISAEVARPGAVRLREHRRGARREGHRPRLGRARGARDGALPDAHRHPRRRVPLAPEVSAYRRWLLAGGLIGLALSPQARRAGIALRARVTRLGRVSTDPVAPFREAP